MNFNYVIFYLVRMEIKDWYSPATFYFADINGKTKFGITNNWSRRESQYIKEFIDIPIIKLREDFYDHYWQAELVEQVMKWRLRRFVVPGLHEWVRKDLPIQSVFDCYNQTKSVLSAEFHLYESFHKKGNDRWGYYKQLKDVLFWNE